MTRVRLLLFAQIVCWSQSLSVPLCVYFRSVKRTYAGVYIRLVALPIDFRAVPYVRGGPARPGLVPDATAWTRVVARTGARRAVAPGSCARASIDAHDSRGV